MRMGYWLAIALVVVGLWFIKSKWFLWAGVTVGILTFFSPAIIKYANEKGIALPASSTA